MYKVLIVLGVIAVLFGAVQLNEYSHGRLDFCFKDQITCATEKMDSIRANRDAVAKERNDFVTEYNKGTVEWNYQEDAKIEAIKDTLPAGYVSDLIKKEDYKNVPKTILERVLTIPQVSANSVETQTNPSSEVSLSVVPAYSPLRYKKVLEDLKSPYANVPIAQYCTNAGLDEYHCDVLIGIAQRESQSGKDLRCTYHT